MLLPQALVDTPGAEAFSFETCDCGM